MASRKPSNFSDDELMAELKKLGYNDVTPDVFNMMKNDLSVLVNRDNVLARKLQNASLTRYTSSLKQLNSKNRDETPDSNENGSPLLHSTDSKKKDMWSNYKKRYNAYRLKIETMSPVDQPSSTNYPNMNVVNENKIEHDNSEVKNGRSKNREPCDSIRNDRVFPKSLDKDDTSKSVSQDVSRSFQDCFISDKPLVSKPSSTNKGIQNKPLNPDGKIKDSKDVSKLFGHNSNSGSNCSPTVSKTYQNNDDTLKADNEQKFHEINYCKPSAVKVKSVNKSNCENSISSKKEDPKSDIQKHRIAVMTRKTKATVEYPSLNLISESQSRSSLKPQIPKKSANYDAKHQDNSENVKPEVAISSSKYVTRKVHSKYEQSSKKNGTEVKKTLKNGETEESDCLTSSDSNLTRGYERQTESEVSLKVSQSVKNSNSVLSVRNHRVSQKLPLLNQSKTSKVSGQNISTSSLDSSNETENNDAESSGISFNSSLDVENQENKFGNLVSFDSSSPEIDDSLPKYRFSTSNRHRPKSPGQNHSSGVPSFNSSPEQEDPLEKYRQRYKLNAYSSQENLGRTSPIKIKRKVLHRRNGESIVTEEFLNVPSIFSSAYPSTDLGLESSKSFSSDDLSFRTSVVPQISRSSYSTPRSIHVRIANQRKKKTDPVAMYNYYKKFWNNFKPPGEKSHDKLRWAVRDKMLDYNL